MRRTVRALGEDALNHVLAAKEVSEVTKLIVPQFAKGRGWPGSTIFHNFIDADAGYEGVALRDFFGFIKAFRIDD